MDTLEQARATQLRNIELKTKKSIDEIRCLVSASKLSKHGEIRQMFIDELGLGYGDANSLVHYALNTDGQSAAEAAGASVDDVLAEIYSGPKAELRPIHERLVMEIDKMGEYTVAPKKGYVSLRRKRQFAMIGPGTKNRIELGLNMKGIETTDRLISLPPGGMCQYKVYVSSLDEVDKDLINWIKEAYETSE